MRILLVGNGLDLMFENDLSKNGMIENALHGKEEYKGNKYWTEFPRAIKNFWKNHGEGELNFNEDDFNKIKSVLLGESNGKSIESIYNQINDSLPYDKRNELLKLFKKYIDVKSKNIGLIKSSESVDMIAKGGNLKTFQFNPMAEKLAGYDLIFTTNYDDLIERFLDFWSVSNNTSARSKKDFVYHVHGKLDGDIFIGDKEQKYKEAIETCRENISELDNKSYLYNSDYDGKFELDIYGWSVNNEEDIINEIVQEITKIVYSNISDKNLDWIRNKKEKPSEFIYTLKKLLKINYYYFSNEDKVETMNSSIFSKNAETGKSVKKIKIPILREMNENSELYCSIDYSSCNNRSRIDVRNINTAITSTVKESVIMEYPVNFIDSSCFVKNIEGYNVMYSKFQQQYITAKQSGKLFSDIVNNKIAATPAQEAETKIIYEKLNEKNREEERNNSFPAQFPIEF